VSDALCERQLTVAHVRAADGHIEVMFFESARIYRLLRDNPTFEATLRRLRAAAASGAPVCVSLDTPNGEVIERAMPAR
jgi:2-methylisocitrate lyase-like PEP mutase family enzyme